MHRSIISFAIVVLSAGWLITQSALAQNQPVKPSGPDAATPNASVSDQKLDQAAAAVENVQKVHDSYAQKLASAPPTEKTKISDEATAATMKAVTDQGLSVEEFNSIMHLAQNDQSVRDKLMKRLGAPAK